MSNITDITPPDKPKGTLVLYHPKVRGKLTKYFHARWLVPEHLRKKKNSFYKTKCLNVSNIKQAQAAAHAWYAEMCLKTKDGQQLDVPTFEEVATKWLAYVEERTRLTGNLGKPLVSKAQFGRFKTSANRYLIKYFGEYRITDIDIQLTASYEHWRENWYVSGPGKDETHIEFHRYGKTHKRPTRKSDKPTSSTISKDVDAFNKIIHFAQVNEKIRFLQIPKIKRSREQKPPQIRRPHFTDEEITLLFKTLGRRRAEQKISKRVRWYRNILLCFCGTLYTTGLRPNEAYGLRIRDIEIIDESEESYRERMKNMEQGILFYVPEDRQNSATRRYEDIKEEIKQKAKLQKTWTEDLLTMSEEEREGFLQRLKERQKEYAINVTAYNPGLKYPTHARQVAPLEEFRNYITVLLGQYLSGMDKSITKDAEKFDDLPGDMWLFCNQDGSRIRRMDQSFVRALNDAKDEKFPDGLRVNEEGENRTLYSFRHSYATNALNSHVPENILANNMGTSTAMLHKHYSHIISRKHRDVLQF